ncbi:hypothetical protein WJX74_007293 [Apatococcus lobatus]|uniref:Rieske domain-containing protein n=2 Tax=Apatococcus TaxID=904362 RepID=A0AAW1QUY7_9CHLO
MALSTLGIGVGRLEQSPVLRSTSSKPYQRLAARQPAVTCSQDSGPHRKTDAFQRTVPKAATLGSSPTQETTKPAADKEPALFNWTKQWYPMAAVQDLDPAVPHPIKLLGKELVLWRDAQGWRALEDNCPHRNVALSEGRIEPSNGSLMCSYHGWCFDGQGKCIAIPTAGQMDRKSEESACNSKRSAVASYPTQEKEGLLWVWAESGPTSFIEASATPAKSNESYASWPGESKIKWTFERYVRDVPGSFDCWVDNMTDQSHAQFAHNGALSKPSTELLAKGYLKGWEPKVNPTGVDFPFSSTKGSDDPTLHFLWGPPAYNGLHKPGPQPSALWIYSTPTGANSTRLIISIGRDSTQKARVFPQPWWKKTMETVFAFIFKSRWMGHLKLHNIDDGDNVFMHKMSSNNWQRAQQEGGKINWPRWQYSPSTSDRGSTAFRRWWATAGGGGPQYADKMLIDHRPADDPNRRHELLDRYSQHTRHCSSCSKALENVQKLMKAAQYVAIAMAFVLAVILGRGTAPFSLPTFAITAVAAGLLWTKTRLALLERRFLFTDWRHADIGRI